MLSMRDHDHPARRLQAPLAAGFELPVPSLANRFGEALAAETRHQRHPAPRPISD
jgi:hypothetical protein